MTRVLVSSRAPLGDWHSSNSPLEYWLSSFRDVAREMVLVSGQSQKILRQHVSSLESFDKQIAATIIEQFLTLPRSKNPRQKEVDFTLLASNIQAFGAGAVPDIRASAEYQSCHDERNRGPQKTETVLQAFDRTLGSLLCVSEAVIIIDAYAISELQKPQSAAREILEARFFPIKIPVTIHGVNPRKLPNSKTSNPELSPPTSSSLKLISHHLEAPNRSKKKTPRFPHLRLWKFELSQGAVVVGLDQGFDTFHPRVPGAISDIPDRGEWRENYDDVLVTTDYAEPFASLDSEGSP